MTSLISEPPVERNAADVTKAMARVGEVVAAANADDVDAEARFPTETIDALREEQLLSALVPVDLGGMGAPLSAVSDGLVQLGRHCASSAMVVAMHHIQVACLVRHGHNPVLRAYVRELVDCQHLLASATTEIGTGGDVGSSICAVQVDDGSFQLEKRAPVISYGSYADGVLATARRSPDSPPNDQVLVLCRPPGLELEPKGTWNALGFRGTCSPGFVLTAVGPVEWILDDAYSDVSSRTMLPVAHLLWSSLWLGIATAAVDRAKRFVQSEARKKPGSLPPAARRLADTVALHQQFSDMVRAAVARYEEAADDPDRLAVPGFALAMNSLKVSASTLVVDIVRQCMVVCGLSSYLLETPYSLGRHLRDAMGASLMVNNDRIMTNNAQLLLAHRSD